jgi:hypothetical protein
LIQPWSTVRSHIKKYSSLMRIEITTIRRPGRSHLQKESADREKGQLHPAEDHPMKMRCKNGPLIRMWNSVYSVLAVAFVESALGIWGIPICSMRRSRFSRSCCLYDDRHKIHMLPIDLASSPVARTQTRSRNAS